MTGTRLSELPMKKCSEQRYTRRHRSRSDEMPFVLRGTEGAPLRSSNVNLQFTPQASLQRVAVICTGYICCFLLLSQRKALIDAKLMYLSSSAEAGADRCQTSVCDDGASTVAHLQNAFASMLLTRFASKRIPGSMEASRREKSQRRQSGVLGK